MSRIESCPRCGGAHLSVHADDRQIRAHDGTMVPYQAQFSRCARCGEEFFTRSQSRAASRAAASAQRRHAKRLLPEELEAIRAMYGVSQVVMERILKFGKKSFARWEAGTVCQSQAADRLLREVRDSPNLFHRLAVEAGVLVESTRDPSAAEWQNFAVEAKVSVSVPHGAARKKPRVKARSVSGIYNVIRRDLVSVPRSASAARHSSGYHASFRCEPA
jgi:putative zinc finger/helix-turn-helix YgiT family protein